MRKEMERRGLFLLCADGRRRSVEYRGILEMVSRFGFISIEEVIYGFGLPFQKAKDRLKYLVTVGLLERFESLTTPKTFFCLSSLGAQVVAAHQVSDEIVPFRPWHYNSLNQRHDRMLIRIYSAMRDIFQDNFKGWVGERTLRQNGSLMPFTLGPSNARVMDGLFLLQVEKEKSSNLSQAFTPNKVEMETWGCGLELELTLKSAARYRKQFKSLTGTVYDAFGKNQRIPLVMFLCGTEAIAKALRKYWTEQRENYGRCLFVFGQVDKFLKERTTAPLTRCLGSEEREITAKEMNRVRVKIVSPQAVTL